MTYEEIVGKAVIKYAKADATAIDGHVAIQFNVTGEGEGAFYIEVSEGKVDVQPYEYYDRNAIVTVASDVLMSVFDGETSIEAAYNDGKLYVDGDLGAALVLGKIVVKAPAKKAAAKKAPAKKAPAKKAAAPKAEKAPVEKKTPAKKAAPKAEAKVEAKAEVKAEAKKAPAKKAAAPKAAKTAEKKPAAKATKATK